MNQSPLSYNADVYAYAMEILLETVIKIIVFGITGYYLGILGPLLSVLMAFVIFRVAIGGNHMSSFVSCLIVSVLVMIGLTKLAIYPGWQAFTRPVIWITLILGVLSIKHRAENSCECESFSIENGLKQKHALILFCIWTFLVIAFGTLGLSLYARCFIVGAFGSLIFTTSFGSNIIDTLDRWSSRFVFERR